jgi:hypothetical protein
MLRGIYSGVLWMWNRKHENGTKDEERKRGVVGMTFIITIDNRDEVKATKFELLEAREGNGIICDQDWIRNLEEI